MKMLSYHGIMPARGGIPGGDEALLTEKKGVWQRPIHYMFFFLFLF